MPQRHEQVTGGDPGLLDDELSSVWVPIVVGVIAGAAIFELLCPTLRRQSLPLIVLPFMAIFMLTIAAFVSGIVAQWICRVMRGNVPGKAGPVVLAACVGGLWVPALVLCIRDISILTVFAGCLCVASVIGSIKKYGSKSGDFDSDAGSSSANKFFYIEDPKPLVRAILPSLGLAMLAEVATTAVIAKNFLLGLILSASCIGVLVWKFGSKASLKDGGRPHISNYHAMFKLTLAIFLTALALLPYVRSARLAGSLDSLLKGNGELGRRADRADTSANGSDGYSGIILLPPPETHKKIVVPQREDAATTGGKRTQPLVIPFDGAYWYFKAPDRRPRATARIVHESSIKAVIRSSDSYPLLMEAHQKLDTPIDIRCCRSVEVAVLNADRHPGPIALELWLLNKKMPGGGALYLGTADIPSSESDRGLTKDAPVEELLEFRAPMGSSRWQFDELSVIVRMPPVRSRVGAQIAIRRFILQP